MGYKKDKDSLVKLLETIADDIIKHRVQMEILRARIQSLEEKLKKGVA